MDEWREVELVELGTASEETKGTPVGCTFDGIQQPLKRLIYPLPCD